MPIHKGHLEIIRKSAKYCNILYVELQYTDRETHILFEDRWKMFSESINDMVKQIAIESAIYLDIRLVCRKYNPDELTSSSERNELEAEKWATVLSRSYPDVNVILGSEDYIKDLGKFMEIEYIKFDRTRTANIISATEIRDNPFKHWNYLPDAVKKYYQLIIVIAGTESTYKSTLTKEVCEYFNIKPVFETARETHCESNTCTISDLLDNIINQNEAINSKKLINQKIIITDTCPITTKGYGKFLFNIDLQIPKQKIDLIIFSQNDAPFIQDGTRLNEDDRNKLHDIHNTNYLLRMSEDFNTDIEYVCGPFQIRKEYIIKIINTLINNK